MSQPSQLVSLEAKAVPFLQLRPGSSTAPEGALPMQVIRRNGTVSKFDVSKISVAMTKAFLAVEGHTAAASRRVHEVVEQLTAEVVGALSRRISEGPPDGWAALAASCPARCRVRSSRYST